MRRFPRDIGGNIGHQITIGRLGLKLMSFNQFNHRIRKITPLVLSSVYQGARGRYVNIILLMRNIHGHHKYYQPRALGSISTI